MAAAILDVDGTLVDTNYQHAIAWYRAFRSHGVVLPVWRIHRHVGMGGDQMVPALCGDDFESEHGDSVRDAEKELYAELVGEVEPIDGARELIRELKEHGHRVVLASSAKAGEVDRYIDQLEAREVADGWTTSADVEATKPKPDLVAAAVDKAGDGAAFMVGDSPWDCISAGRAGVETIGLLTGGFAESELREAGAVAVFDSLQDVRARLGELPALAGVE
jgi:phosphoglycolate phosphatase-like HAD superfamily hydrolase